MIQTHPTPNPLSHPPTNKENYGMEEDIAKIEELVPEVQAFRNEKNLTNCEFGCYDRVVRIDARGFKYFIRAISEEDLD